MNLWKAPIAALAAAGMLIAGATASLASGQHRTAAAVPAGVPWHQVGPGWVLAQYSKSRPGGGHSGPETLDLISPSGTSYQLASWPDNLTAPSLLSWSPDGTRALLQVPAGNNIVYEQMTLATGVVSRLTGRPAAAAISPQTLASSRAETTPRRAASSESAAADSRTYCQRCPRASASGIAEPAIAPITDGPAPVRNAWIRRFPRSGHSYGQQRTCIPGSGEPGHGRGLHHRPRCDLPEGDGVEELSVGHPVVGVHGIVLHQRNDDEPSAVGQRADLECLPRQRREAPGRGGGRQDKRQERAGQRGGRSAEQRVTDPTGTCGAHGTSLHASPAGRGQPPRGLHRHRGNRGPGSGRRTEHEQRRARGQEQRRQRHDHHQAGQAGRRNR
jgi:hypothetical protein